MKKITILVLAVSFLLAVTSGCGIGSNDLKIGVSAPLTGEIAALGMSTKNAILMAEAEINANGGIKIGEEMRKVKFHH